MQCFDAMIVGAGPAGSTCAAKLKSAGLSVKLFDKSPFPRVKPCAGWITPEVIQALDFDSTEYSQQFTFQPILGFRTGLIGGKSIDTNYPAPVSFGIRRYEFDHYLLNRSGVACEFSPVKHIDRKDDQWCINDTWVAPLLIGAGGHFCPVARWLRGAASSPSNHQSLPTNSHSNSTTNQRAHQQKIARAEPPTVYAQEVEFEMRNPAVIANVGNPQKPELYFCDDLSGYGWCFRKGNYLNIGLGRTNKTDLAQHVDSFCQFLRQLYPDLDEIPDRFAGHAYRLYATVEPRLIGDQALLIGDAAGLAYPYSGEGIRPAVESALLAADVISNANGNYPREVLTKYEEQLRGCLGRVKPMRQATWLPHAWLRFAAAQLLSSKRFTKNVVIENWFLHRNKTAV